MVSRTVGLCLLVLAVVGGSGSLPAAGPGSEGPFVRASVALEHEPGDCTEAATCGVPSTGQTDCWDFKGVPISCSGTGQDGEYQAGTTVAQRFTNNGDGTVTDALTGLVWLQDASCFGPRSVTGALAAANDLASGSCGLTDGSVAGDWRLPNVKELYSLVDCGQCEPAVPADHPFIGVQSQGYWSSTTCAVNPAHAWLVDFYVGGVNRNDKAVVNRVWPVRGGH